MDSAFNQPTSTTPRRNWQLDQCYREGCKLERELAEAQNLLKQCLSAMPVGYIPTHTAENLPEMIGDLAKALAEETTERENLERELATVTEQRDKLAEELKEAQDTIGLMLKDSSCRTIPRYTKENLIIQTGEEL
jgi:hypothetical protein